VLDECRRFPLLKGLNQPEHKYLLVLLQDVFRFYGPRCLILPFVFVLAMGRATDVYDMTTNDDQMIKYG
jgi:hypothetical protein